MSQLHFQRLGRKTRQIAALRACRRRRIENMGESERLQFILAELDFAEVRKLRQDIAVHRNAPQDPQRERSSIEVYSAQLSPLCRTSWEPCYTGTWEPVKAWMDWPSSRTMSCMRSATWAAGGYWPQCLFCCRPARGIFSGDGTTRLTE